MLNKCHVPYKYVFNISEQELADLYAESDIISFPSLYEGFGMPIIEGQLSDSVVLTSNLSPMTEIGRDSVYYVNPYSVNSIRQGFMTLINDGDMRKNLIMKGRENAKRFSCNVIAKQYLELYKNVFL